MVTARSVVLGITAGILVVVPVWRLPIISVSGAGWLLVVVGVEEVAFRGVLFALLRQAGGLPLAIAGSAVAFTVAHAASAGGPSLLLAALSGLYFGLLRAIRGDLWTSGFAHFLMDLVSLS
jgi:membrane protease YdiL (CAAX protease family)